MVYNPSSSFVQLRLQCYQHVSAEVSVLLADGATSLRDPYPTFPDSVMVSLSRVETFKAMNMKNAVFCDTMQRHLAEIYQYFGGMCRLHPQSRRGGLSQAGKSV